MPLLGVVCLLAPLQADATEPPSLRDIEIAGQVLAFQSDHTGGGMTLGVVFNPDSSASRSEAEAILGLIGRGLNVGKIFLTARAIPQGALRDRPDVGALLVTGDVDQALLRTVLAGHHLLCLTRHLDEVAHGACTVAICSKPAVDIVINDANATAADVHFATAFRMMVREI
ncbi:hypothetical protein FHR90_002164 [Endobacter medicaginis]|uniref:YfiR family protein n=1 Tax=Endobacter medicaginis TaxID=1181271 RepID=A0A839V0X2_9PROT|nr:hypothetical protein [Endobacter medicaginis]MBB3174323.1 hypothetical protein [Endobacter medicaginis]MCX5476648.1 hypothetical protein [Endobacter medicaginis]NVN29964.1 hypothetical protein [Endobacter medicaginis]